MALPNATIKSGDTKTTNNPVGGRVGSPYLAYDRTDFYEPKRTNSETSNQKKIWMNRKINESKTSRFLI